MAILATDLLQARKGDRLSSVFSPDGTLISSSAAPHCGVKRGLNPSRGTNLASPQQHLQGTCEQKLATCASARGLLFLADRAAAGHVRAKQEKPAIRRPKINPFSAQQIELLLQALCQGVFGKSRCQFKKYSGVQAFHVKYSSFKSN